MTDPPELAVKVTLYEGIAENVAFRDVSPLIVIVKDGFVPVSFPLQPAKIYPVLGVAVRVTEVPSSYSPPVVETEPPFPAVTESVNLGVTGA